MPTVGIVGGIAPESTIEYYRLIVAGYLEQEAQGNYPQIIINSINMKKMLDLIGQNRRVEVTQYLAGEVNKLAAAGADFALLASNTPHIVFNEVQAASSLPLISIVEATCQKAHSMQIRKAGLFGTRFTMQGGFYEQVFVRRGIEIVVPDADDQAFIHEKYMSELVKGIFLDETHKAFVDVIRKMKVAHAIQGLILGGTELPLILKRSDDPAIPYLDTTRIHVEQVFKELISR